MAASQAVVPSSPKGKGGRDMACAAADQGGVGVAEEGLDKGEDGVRPDARCLSGAVGGQDADGADAEGAQKGQHLVLHHIGQRADDEKLAGVGSGQCRDKGRQTGILTLREGRLDARTGEVDDLDARVDAAQALGGAGEVQLDDLGRAGPDKEQLLYVRTARQKLGHLAVKLGVGVGKTGQILLFENRRAEAGFGENHHPCGRLEEMRAGAGPDDQEERVLHLAVQPDDARQSAEHLALAALFQDGRVAASARGGQVVHAPTPASRRAARSFRMN